MLGKVDAILSAVSSFIKIVQKFILRMAQMKMDQGVDKVKKSKDTSDLEKGING